MMHRALLHSPVHAATVLSIGIAVGFASTALGVGYSVFLKPLPFEEPDRVVVIAGISRPPFGTRLEWFSTADTFDVLAEYQAVPALVEAPIGVSEVVAAHVSPGFFRAAGLRLTRGRGPINPALDRKSPGPAVISSTLASRLGLELGSSVRISEHTYEIIGIVPSSGGFPEGCDFWTTDSSIVSDARAPRRVIGRLKRGFTIERATAQLQALQRSHESIASQTDTQAGTGSVVVVRTLRDTLLGDFHSRALLLVGGAALVLLAGCLNAILLLISGARSRAHDVAVRLALGATARHLFRDRLLEVVSIAFGAGVIGFIVHQAVSAAQKALFPSAFASPASWFIPALAFGMAFLLSGLVTVGAHWRLSRENTVTLLHRSFDAASHKGSRSRMLPWLGVAQTTLAVWLSVLATSIGSSVLALSRADAGFAGDGTVLVDVRLQPRREAGDEFPAALNVLTAASPTGEVAFIDKPPLGGMPRSGFWFGLPHDETQGDVFLTSTVSPGYFRLMNIPIIRGRSFGPQDGAGAPPVMILNDVAARQLWPGVDPIGKQLKVERHLRTVVGVASSVKYERPDEEGGLQAYVPLAQAIRLGDSAAFVLRVGDQNGDVLARVRAIMNRENVQIHVTGVRSVGALKQMSLRAERVLAGAALAAAGTAVLLCLLGILGMTGDFLRRSRREFGLRSALGASPRNLAMVVLRRFGTPVTIGWCFGLTLSYWSTRIMPAVWSFARHAQETTVAVVAAGVLVVSLAAAAVAGRRMYHANPRALLVDDSAGSN